ncbi:MAG: hypothetical protein VX086_02380 [Pseudomonadota bacterium]|nr:hypothetical protein [Pseudomonadota bacterium]
MANIVHVGRVKTATTSLQKYVFSEIPKIRPKVIFNASNLIRYIDLFKLGFLEEENLRILKKCLAEQNHFISRESLVGWNPRSWRRNADENLELFRPDATIIITVRKTESFLRSVYQQTIHEGNVRHAENFFLNAKNYDAVKPFFSEYESSWFDVDSYDLRILEGIYRERFKKIIFVSLSDLKELSFLRDIFDLTPIEHAQLCRKLEFGKK